MPAYKYQTKDGKTKWYANFYYTDWRGEKKHKCKRGFQTRREALEYERNFIDQGSKDPTILFSSLVENYLTEYGARLKPTTLENKRFLIETKLTPYFGQMRICDIDPITVHRWQNELLDYQDADGKGYSQTYLKSIHSQLSAIMNYAVKFYQLRSNPCVAAGGIGKSHADEMKFWTKDQFDQFLENEKKMPIMQLSVYFSMVACAAAKYWHLLQMTFLTMPLSVSIKTMK
ncbi:MAG: Arm DNA-binding domain-containing protein [Lachnospiraceae bacterium]|nr:Arm DNA-binding domain-containing protein [Lachnospiraceae bacterium]